MFWKKKKSSKPADPFGLRFDEGPRYYFRVRPAPSGPVYFQIGGRRHQVYDISAGGLALWAPDLTQGQKVSGMLHLPTISHPLPLVLLVRNVGPEGLVGGQFAKIREEDREYIHLYVLMRQKEEISEQRGGIPTPTEVGK